VDPGPVAPGTKWPAPPPLPPEEEGRAWWKVAVPAAVVVVLLVVGLVVVLGGGGDGGDEAADPGKRGSVDISDVDDPTTTRRPESTTTTEETTTTIVATNGRIVLESPSGITWTMAAAPEVTEDGDVTTWTATKDGITETVRIYGSTSGDLDGLLADQVTDVDGTLSEIKGSHIEEADGRTASYTGTNADGEPVVGYLVGAVVGDEVVIAGASRDNSSDLDGLYLDFLDLPASFDLG
jgi:hypothetical protein